ncbi:hypothetical protein GBZ86_13740 [Clostridium tarantellae]|uniref:Uncharacterized protein n=2 Tax=Clostridium tarantellae TaxID=39493 RepID=A0A6I1MQN2_9CLOT|nr:hypothetical protein [Clostridium tarantellae]
MKIIPKKGVINKWHYAHKIKSDCDGANRNKTQWHLDWQKKFKSDFVEVPFVNDTLKKMHIADV